MKLKPVAKTVGRGLLNGLVAIADAQTQNQINEIDRENDALRKQMTQLQERRDRLEGTLSY